MRGELTRGELLCGQDRHREAARLLAKGWRMAVSQHGEGVLQDAAPAIRAAYRADPDHFSAVWQAETGTQPPDWLSTLFAWCGRRPAPSVLYGGGRARPPLGVRRSEVCEAG